jgi:hypothetical protein
MPATGSSTTLRALLEDRISQLSVEVENLFLEAREHGRRESADQLNQAVRRIRQSPDVEELGAILIDAASAFAGGAALFHVDESVVRAERVRGLHEENAEAFLSLEVALESAAALATAVESRDPVVAASTPGELSPEIVKLAGHSPEGRVYIFPVVPRDRAVALVYAWGAVQGSAVELLAQVAAAVWSEFLAPPEPEAVAPEIEDEPDDSGLVQIAPAAAEADEETVEELPEEMVEPPPPPKAASKWEQLSPEEQQIHLRAQRVARVRVAGMRLYDSEAVQSGRAQRNLFAALRPAIERAREEFHREFFSRCPTMVDYLHLEILRNLANDDAELLGEDYPGPLA